MERAEYEAMALLEDEHWWFKGKRAVARSLLGPFWKRGARVLDVGCGTGGTTAFMEEAGAKVLGCELNPIAAAFACKRLGPQGAVVRGRAEALPVRSGSMDFVTAFDVLYHRDVDEPAAIREWRRVLALGGILYVSDSALPCLTGPHDEAVHARERYTAQTLASRVRDAGFQVLRVTYWNFLLLPLVLAVRLGRRAAGGGEASDLKRVPRTLNDVLGRILSLEAALLRRGRIPIGSSVALIARRT
ncbi:MAG: class I SAM-dependent methyltransferase [Nitrospirota bacterium]